MNTAANEINKRLQEAIDGLRKDCLRVEIWASALREFSQPAPQYDLSKNDPFRGYLIDSGNQKDDEKVG
jgi:hypothetical protein